MLLLLLACTGPSDDKPQTNDDTAPEGCDTVWYNDVDGDGFGDPEATAIGCEPLGQQVSDGTDCDDDDAATHPGADESCEDPTDRNCDGSVGYADADADGTAACLDCDDTDATAHPGASEFCDGVDDDCDGEVDEDAVDGRVAYADTDGDGYGDRDSETRTCEIGEGWTTDFADCDDADATINPAATEICDGVDQDCDGSPDDDASDATLWYGDDDGDGWGVGTGERSCDDPGGSSNQGGDCDDEDAAVNPDAVEVCNGVDDDCEGSVDGSDAADPSTWYEDRDTDGWGNVDRVSVTCDAPTGYVALSGDCDDTWSGAAPDVTETCDASDNDCDGDVDEDDASDAPTWYTDADGDGYGDIDLSFVACEAPTGTVSLPTDCDDADADTSPGAPELCGGGDENCDGDVDEDDAGDAPTWYLDGDGDGFGDAAVATTACAEPAGFVADTQDCDDGDAATNPDGVEVCGGADEDCDGVVDEDDASDAPTWYQDGDGDGWGAVARTACLQPAGYDADGGDCDDTDTLFHPFAAEDDCEDPADYNCDGSVGLVDGDGDGYAACEDCDDATVDVSPSATETCDGLDDDCDGTVDEAGAVGAGSWYADTDGDGFGDPDVVDHSCELPSGYSALATDCDDADADVSPAGTEVCATAYDDDCDGQTEERNTPDCTRYYLDLDEDGYGSTSNLCACASESWFTADNDEDCDDGDAGANPGAVEVANNGVDDDCDGITDIIAFTDATLRIASSTSGDSLGSGVAAGWDFDGDGDEDLAVGAYEQDSGGTTAGLVAVVPGESTGLLDLADLDDRLVGESAGDQAGWALAGGDVDGDGIGDLLVGADYNDSYASNAGAAYLIYGPITGESSLATADVLMGGGNLADYSGYAVALPGDTDGDGVGDLLIGAIGVDTGGSSSGSIYLVLGGGSSGQLDLDADAELYGARSDQAGQAVAGAGDTDGDGLEDVVVGVELSDSRGTTSGSVYLFEGGISGVGALSTLASANWTGEGANDRAGTAVDGVGDVDGDGYADLAVGASSAGTTGSAYVLFGPFSGTGTLADADVILAGGGTSAALGGAICGDGDMDGDGRGDVAVGDVDDTSGGTTAGAVWIFSGISAGSYDTDDAAAWVGTTGDALGLALNCGADTDGDGLKEVSTGAPFADTSASDGGVAGLLR